MVDSNKNLIIESNIGTLSDGSKFYEDSEILLIKNQKEYEVFIQSLPEKLPIVKGKKKANPEWIDNNDPWKTRTVDFTKNHLIISVGRRIESVILKDGKYFVSYNTDYIRDNQYYLVLLDKLAEDFEESDDIPGIMIEQRPMNMNMNVISDDEYIPDLDDDLGNNYDDFEGEYDDYDHDKQVSSGGAPHKKKGPKKPLK